MLKRIIFLIIISQLLLIACSNLGDRGLDQNSVDNIRKAQEVAKISRDIYDIQGIINNDEVSFSTVAASFKVFGLTDYSSFADLLTELDSMTKSLDDGDLSLTELQEYSRLTETMILILDPPDNQTKSDYPASGKETDKKTKVVTLAEVNAYDLDSIDDFKLPENTFDLAKLDLLDSLYYYKGELYTGRAYSSFKNGQISEYKTIKNGLLSGPSYAWYEDGTHAMQANFLDGYLAGRFIAWSEVGDTIYDIFFNKGQFKSDLQYERDTTREESDGEATEGEADSEGNSGE